MSKVGAGEALLLAAEHLRKGGVPGDLGGPQRGSKGSWWMVPVSDPQQQFIGRIFVGVNGKVLKRGTTPLEILLERVQAGMQTAMPVA